MKKRRKSSPAQSKADQLAMWLEKDGTKAAGAVATVLDSCRPNFPCQRWACPMCCHTFQTGLAAAVVDLWDPDEPTSTMTLIPEDGVIPYDELPDFDLLNFVRRHTEALKRAWGKGKVAMVAAELSLNTFDNANPVWQAHLHVTLEGELSRDAEKRIRRRYASHPELGIHRPVRIEVAEPGDLTTVTEYPLKGVIRRSAYKCQPKPERKRRPHLVTASQPLKPHQAVRLALIQADYDVVAPVNLVGMKPSAKRDGCGYRLKRIPVKSND